MVLHPEPLQHLALCSGYGGFELGLRLAGVAARTVAHVERDSYAAATLVARMEEAALDRAPIWSDLATFDGAPWRGRVDLVTAGFPCQPFSAAGQRRGVDDDRWLWPEIARIVDEVGPGIVFLENVPGVVKHGLPLVLADLAELGFDAEWGLLSASDVGASHRRQRFWLVAYADVDGLQGIWREPGDDRDAWDDADGSSGAPVGDAASVGCVPGFGPGPGESSGRRADIEGPGAAVADADSQGWPRREPAEPGGREVAPRGGGWPPLPDDTGEWERWIAAGGPEPSLRRITHGRPVGLADALHLGGNGLVPRVAAVALRQLITRARQEA